MSVNEEVHLHKNVNLHDAAMSAAGLLDVARPEAGEPCNNFYLPKLSFPVEFK